MGAGATVSAVIDEYEDLKSQQIPIEEVKLRIKDKFFPQISNSGSWTKLQVALISKNLKAVEILLQDGCNPKFIMPPEDDMFHKDLMDGIHFIENAGNYPPNFFGYVSSSQTTTEPNSIEIKFVLHDACKIGDVSKLIILLLTNPIDKIVWMKDNFDNIPIYYSILYGHKECCAWLLIAMRGLDKIPKTEKERFVMNSLNLTIKHMLLDTIKPTDVIQNPGLYKTHSHTGSKLLLQATSDHDLRSSTPLNHQRQPGQNEFQKQNMAEEGGEEEDMGLSSLFDDS